MKPTYTNRHATSAHRHLNAAYAAVARINARPGVVYPLHETKAKVVILDAIDKAREYMGQLTMDMHANGRRGSKRGSRKAGSKRGSRSAR